MATNVSERDKKVLRELIEWLGKERDYVLQWRGKDGKGLVNDAVRPIDPWTHEANIFAYVIRHCENLLESEDAK